MDAPNPLAKPPFLRRLARACHDRRRTVVAAWVLAIVLLGGVLGSVGSGYSTEFSLPDVETADGLELLEEHFGGAGGGGGGNIVFVAEQGVTDPAVQAAMVPLFETVAALDAVNVNSPYTEPAGRFQVASQGPLAGKLAFAQIEFTDDFSISEAAEVREVIDENLPELPGLQVEIGGQFLAGFESPDSEALGLAFAVVILVLSFGSVVAMGLPVATALGGIIVGIILTTLLSNVIEMPDFTTSVGLLIGLGVGIDYALFIVTRYREELHRGTHETEATEIAINTAGRAVLFAGVTVVVSLLGMLLMGLGFVRGLAIGASLVVFVTMLASVTLLPALLGFVGSHLERTKVRGVVVAGLVALGLFGVGLELAPFAICFPLALLVGAFGGFVPALDRELTRRPQKPLAQTTAYRWSRVIQRRPWPAMLLGAAALLACTVPVLDLRLGFSDEGNFPEESTTRKAYDLLAEGFGPGFNGPLAVVAELPAGAPPDTVQRVNAALAATEGVAFASPGFPDDPQAPVAFVWRVIPATAPQSVETEDLVFRLRDEVLPAATEGTGMDALVTGEVAGNVDFSTYLGNRLPLFIGAVLTVSFLLLMTVFRSILVPLKAVLMNLLSIGAAYGLAVAVFQWGWLADLFGVKATGPIEPFIPMMLFAIVFGLSMDYEVFMLSRIREEYDRGSSNAKAVADGLASTARVITAAAAIMVFVFGSFQLEDQRTIKLMGFGLAVAVLLDATVVRMLLVPATMELLGDRNWWLPRWLDRILPRIDVEGEHQSSNGAVSNEGGDEDDLRPEPVGVG